MRGGRILCSVRLTSRFSQKGRTLPSPLTTTPQLASFSSCVRRCLALPWVSVAGPKLRLESLNRDEAFQRFTVQKLGAGTRAWLVVDDRGRDTSCLVPPGGRGGHPSPAPTERSVQFYRTTLFRSWFTALWLELAAPHKGDAAWVAAKGTVP
jgi:hypothetical protein